MVSGDVANRCRTCGYELIGRDEVEKIVRGEDHLYVERKYVRWHSYRSGHSFVYDSFNGKVGAGGQTKNIVCGCNVVKKVASPALLMIREEFRKVVQDKLGDRFPVFFLFKLPVEVVAWENSGFAMVSHGKDGFEFSTEGEALIEFIADMSRQGCFDGATSRISLGDLVNNYSYLYLVKPEYRSCVAMEYGPSVTVSRLFASLPLSWVDWEEMYALKCIEAPSGMELSRVVGVPLVAYATTFMSRALRKAVFKPVVAGTAVVSTSLCVQFMPRVEDSNGITDDWPESSSVSEVLLKSGQSFVPMGYVRMHGNRIAVTFEPGVVLATRRGTRMSVSGGSVTVFVNGTVDVLLTSERFERQVKYASVTRGMSHTVAIVCDSYASDTALGKWYARRFDVLSTSARFYGGRAELLVLSAPALRERGQTWAENQVVDLVGPCDDWRGDQVDRHEGHVLCEVSDMSKLGVSAAVYRGYKSQSGMSMVLAGSVYLTDDSAVGVLGPVTCGFRVPDVRSSVDVKSLTDARLARYQFECVTIADSYVIDSGGPSASDGEYFDDTGTFEKSTAVERLLRLAEGDTSTGIPGLLLPDSDTMVHDLGTRPSIRKLLAYEHVLPDLAVFDRTGWIKGRYGTWRLRDTGGPYDLTWSDLAVVARTWFQSLDRFGDGESLIEQLSEYYDHLQEPILYNDSMCTVFSDELV